MWSYTGFPSPFRSLREAWKLGTTCRSVLLHMQSLPVGPYRYKILHRFASKYIRTPARGGRVAGRALAGVFATWLHGRLGGCRLGCICVPGLGTGGPIVITIHAGSQLRLPRQLGREKHQQREAGERGQLTNLGRRADDSEKLPRTLGGPTRSDARVANFSSHLVLALEADARRVD
jgi:hypothetical protein